MKKFFIIVLALFIFLFSGKIAYGQEVYTTNKLITVDTSKQMLYAWERGNITNQTPVSTGLPLSPTIKGSFKIERKYITHDMKGYSPYKGNYYLPNVPHTMYFYQGYAIHGAYWHNSFGSPASNGCVNLPLEFAAWLYAWTPEGTILQVY